jgi:hypothetical protein
MKLLLTVAVASGSLSEVELLVDDQIQSQKE